MSKSISFLLMILSVININAQDATLPSLEELELSLTTFTMQECDAKVKAFEVSGNSDWQELLPSFGIAYTPSGSPRPSASWSPLQLLDRKDKKKKLEAECASIRLSYELILHERVHKLRQLYRDYQIDLEMANVDIESMEIEEKLFAIEEEKYQQHLTKPSMYLKSKKKILDLRAKRRLALMDLEKKKSALIYQSMVI